MNEPEVRRLLGYISAGYDNRQLSAATAAVWTEELCDVEFEVAKQAVRNHFRKPAPRAYLSLDVLLEQIRVDTRQTPTAIEEDVRSAKARGFIEASWPARQALPRPIAARLAAARLDFALAAEAIEAGVIETPRALDVGTVGREVPG
ncbi:hypothetical protein [Curtobacterium sp. CFBP9011]|uniref:hypothetical protein n=1 Tax=Curtobacterium sp. CFBP9011 TaxID=3096530 RepID=UPI002A6AB020|nr:hypothetical protein [Curtobacterium sp. CFBP9011]MDY1005724.1 hypothetical protein [Curtobacterium sp. CFBP9011]